MSISNFNWNQPLTMKKIEEYFRSMSSETIPIVNFSVEQINNDYDYIISIITTLHIPNEEKNKILFFVLKVVNRAMVCRFNQNYLNKVGIGLKWLISLIEKEK